MLLPHPVFRPEDLVGARNNSPALRNAAAGLRYTYNGRSALFQTMRGFCAASRPTILVPAFHCPTVIDPVIAAGFRPEFYSVDASLQIDSNALVRRIGRDVAAVIVVRYFGWQPPIDTLRAACDAENIPLIEDCSHSFLSCAPLRLTGETGHIATFSPWKLLPCTSLGAIRINDSRRGKLLDSAGPGLADELSIARRSASEAITHSTSALARLFRSTTRRPFVDSLPKRDTDGLQPQPPPTIDYPFDPRLAQLRGSRLAQMVMHHSNWESIAVLRRRNYRRLADRLRLVGGLRTVLADLPEDVCPWALPVAVPERAAIDYKLRHSGVPLFTFGETLHAELAKASPIVAAEAAMLSNTLFCLPVHQQITEPEIDWMADTINRLIS